MYRALAVLRIIVLANTVVIYGVRQHGYAHPGAGWVVMTGLVAWTGLVTWAYDRPVRRGGLLLGADLAVAVAAILLSPYVKGAGLHATLPGFWVMAVVLAWAIRWHWAGGLTAAAAVSAADLSIRGGVSQQTYGYIFLLLLGGAMVGFLAALLEDMAAQRDQAERAAAAAEERQRLARVVHDGVLQVLALVQRRAHDFGPEARELGLLAGEQESRLRALVQRGAEPDLDRAGDRDLAALLAGLGSTTVQVAVPGRVVVPARTADEVLGAVEACLSNVRHHVGRDASAWILLEDLGDRLVVSVRDEGPGIAPGRLVDAAEQGRLGVRESIVGRLRDLGGDAVVHSAPGAGTEWELTVPRERSRAR